MVNARGGNKRPGARRFDTTHWSVVRAAGNAGTPESRRALETLFVKYRGPVQEFIQWKWTCTSEKALEWTQGFFARLIEKRDVAAADPARGKFRSWLLTAVHSYCLNAWHDERRHNGEGQARSIDDTEGPAYKVPAPGPTPEQLFERRWAMTILTQALHRLRDEYIERDQAQLFEKLKPCLVGWDEQKHEDIARSLGIARVNTFNVTLTRFKQRFRALLREEIAPTVSNEDEIEEELAYLASILRSR